MLDLVIKNAVVVTVSDTFETDLGIRDGKIVALAENLNVSAKKLIEAKGKYLLPGVIDAHVHFQLPFCGTVSCQDFVSGTSAAACGGITTVIDFAIQEKGKTLAEAVQNRRREAEDKVVIDYSLHSAITDWNRNTAREMETIVNQGVSSFKLFMIYKNWMADDQVLLSVLERSRQLGAMICLHAESFSALEHLLEFYHTPKIIKRYGAYAHSLARPCYTEEEAVWRACKWAEVTGGNLYLVHLSSAEGAETVRKYKEKGLKVFGETCPHYLLFTDDVFKNKKTGHLYATCPQIKKEHDRKGLWDGLAGKYLDTVATDTCSFTNAQKAVWNGDFTKIPYGLPGVETLLPLIYTYGVQEGKITLNRLVELLSTRPAKLFGLYPQKGNINIGADADMVLIDPRKKIVYNCKKFKNGSGWSPYQGWKLSGYPELTISRGEIVAKNGKFSGQPGRGKFIKRSKVIL